MELFNVVCKLNKQANNKTMVVIIVVVVVVVVVVVAVDAADVGLQVSEVAGRQAGGVGC